VITSLPPHEGSNLSFHALDEQFDLLDKVGVLFVIFLVLVSYCNFCLCYFKQILNTWDNMVGVEHLEEDSDGKARLKARHSAG
jgi:DNA excision repair protein ERCC-3